MFTELFAERIGGMQDDMKLTLSTSVQERPKLVISSMKSIENDSNHTSSRNTTGDSVNVEDIPQINEASEESFINIKDDIPESLSHITTDLPEENITTQEILITNQEENNNNTMEFVLQIGTAAIISLAGGGIG
nr:uncharacterized protein LOC111517023 [Leptinotarsa decemlineata]